MSEQELHVPMHDGHVLLPCPEAQPCAGGTLPQPGVRRKEGVQTTAASYQDGHGARAGNAPVPAAASVSSGASPDQRAFGSVPATKSMIFGPVEMSTLGKHPWI